MTKFLIYICLLIFTADVSAQVSTREQELKGEENRVLGRNHAPTGFPNPITPTSADKPSKAIIEAKSREASKRRSEREIFESGKKSIKVPSGYYQKYEKFLNLKNTGLARIYKDKDCDQKLTVSVTEAERCADAPTVPGGGSYYSFRKKANYSITNDGIDLPDSNGWWDIHFINGNFIVGNCCTQGIIAEVGNIAIESIDLNSLPLTYLKNYQAGKTAKSIQKQNNLLLQGVKSNGFTYARKSPVKLDTSYVLRSIEYENKNLRDGDAILDKKSDSIFVYKAVGQENDGSIILLWKKL